MNKKAYQAIVGAVIDSGMYKTAEETSTSSTSGGAQQPKAPASTGDSTWDWKSVWEAIKKHFAENKDHYIRAGVLALPLGLGIGAATGSARKGLWTSLLAAPMVWAGSKYWPDIQKWWAGNKQSAPGGNSGQGGGASGSNTQQSSAQGSGASGSNTQQSSAQGGGNTTSKDDTYTYTSSDRKYTPMDAMIELRRKAALPKTLAAKGDWDKSTYDRYMPYLFSGSWDPKARLHTFTDLMNNSNGYYNLNNMMTNLHTPVVSGAHLARYGDDALISAVGAADIRDADDPDSLATYYNSIMHPDAIQ